MFEIIENDFLNTGRVKYEDEFGNKILVIAEKDGNSFITKIRPANKVKIKPIELQYPYDLDGINVSLDYENKEDVESLTETLNDAAKVVERWVYISKDLKGLFSDKMSQLSNLISKSFEDKEMLEIDIVNSILADLLSYNETKSFVELYAKLIDKNANV